MAAAEAIKSKETQLLVSRLIGKHHKPIYKDAFDLNMCLALRAGDLLQLSYEDLLHPDGTIRDHLTIREQKTRNVKNKALRKIKLTSTAKDIILKRREQNKTHTYLFESDSNRSKGKPLTYYSLYRCFNAVAEIVRELTGEFIQFSTHTCRKTLGYRLWERNVDIATICKFLHHTNPAVTMVYLGIVQENVDECHDLLEMEV